MNGSPCCFDSNGNRAQGGWHITALQGVHVLKSVMELDVGGVVWFATFDPLVLLSYPFYKIHPTLSPQSLPVLAPNDEE